MHDIGLILPLLTREEKEDRKITRDLIEPAFEEKCLELITGIEFYIPLGGLHAHNE